MPGDSRRSVGPELPFILIVHAAATWAMTGLIWFVQVVHYPLMGEVGEERWLEYERQHQRRTTWVVAPLMLVEVITAVGLIVLLDRDLAWSAPSMILAALGLVMLLAVWLSTFFLQVPRHARLERGFDGVVHRSLVRSNWVRTVLWSARAVVAGVLLNAHSVSGRFGRLGRTLVRE
jgi:hypothetical protein